MRHHNIARFAQPKSTACHTSRSASGTHGISNATTQDALVLPVFDGGNMGVRRRQLHALMREPAYDRSRHPARP
jgi:hypothetical protein